MLPSYVYLASHPTGHSTKQVGNIHTVSGTQTEITILGGMTTFKHNLKMVDSLVGFYKFERNENFESFLSATGVPFIPRKMMVSVSPSVNISKDGEVWTVTFNVLFKSFSIQFELGKTFVEDNPVSKEINKVNTRSNNN